MIGDANPPSPRSGSSGETVVKVVVGIALLAFIAGSIWYVSSTTEQPEPLARRWKR